MFQQLTDKLGSALRNIRGMGKLTESNMAEALKEVRTALLSADVHFRVAREFVDRVGLACQGEEVIRSITPGQQVIKIIHDELVKLLGEGATGLAEKRPLKILLVGLHGSGKTTTAGKLAQRLAKSGHVPALVACDVYRPAAVEQLRVLAEKGGNLFFSDEGNRDVPSIGKKALAWAKEKNASAVIFDTAGRLQIDSVLIEEVVKLREIVQPDEVLLVADSALGQEAVSVAKHFHEAVPLTGIILTRLDGDARGGAALSMKSVTGVPIKFVGVGEKPGDLEVFHPDRMAQRILGMGDVVSLVEKAQEVIQEDEMEAMTSRMFEGDFNLQDFLAQLQSIKRLGPLGSLMKMLPGMGKMEVGDNQEKEMKRTEAIILSMTPMERRRPQILNGSRRMRIARGSGTEVREVNTVLKKFQSMQKMLKQMKSGRGFRQMMKQLGGR